MGSLTIYTSAACGLHYFGITMKFELEPDNRGAPDQVLLDDLRKVAALLGKNSVPRDDYDKNGRFHSKTLVKRFGSWNAALDRAALEVRKPNNLGKEACIEDLRRVAQKLEKKSVTIEEYRDLGRFTEGPFRRLFGGWVAALGAAGLEAAEGFKRPNTVEELYQNLEAVWNTVGRQPKQSDMRFPLSTIGHDAYCRRFGSWRKALEAFVAYANGDSDETVSIEQSAETAPSTSVEAPQPTSRNISWRLRFLVMRRDGFRCQQCGRSPSVTPGTVLVIDHIHPWSKGGESVYDNLRTLCEVCNGGKSDLSLHPGDAQLGSQPDFVHKAAQAGYFERSAS